MKISTELFEQERYEFFLFDISLRKRCLSSKRTMAINSDSHELSDGEVGSSAAVGCLLSSQACNTSCGICEAAGTIVQPPAVADAELEWRLRLSAGVRGVCG